MKNRRLIRVIASLLIISIVGNCIVFASSDDSIKLPSVADVYQHLGKGEDYVAEECLIVNSVSNELNGHMLSVLELENGDCIIFELYNGLLVVEAIIDSGGIYTEIDYSKSGRLKTIDYSVSSADNARKKQKTDEQLRDTGTEGYIYFNELDENGVYMMSTTLHVEGAETIIDNNYRYDIYGYWDNAAQLVSALVQIIMTGYAYATLNPIALDMADAFGDLSSGIYIQGEAIYGSLYEVSWDVIFTLSGATDHFSGKYSIARRDGSSTSYSGTSGNYYSINSLSTHNLNFAYFAHVRVTSNPNAQVTGWNVVQQP